MAGVLDEIELAEEVGLDFFGLGEHHRPEFLDSAPAMILADAAARTSRIGLTSAVKMLSAEDPVRVFQNFATLDLISRGRAEIVAGRGSSVEAFPLFGLPHDRLRRPVCRKTRPAAAVARHGQSDVERPFPSRADGTGRVPATASRIRSLALRGISGINPQKERP